jgi:dTDP-4-amino-4,6-dideoxygalactose transaminase
MKLTGVKQYLKSKEASHPQAIRLLRKGAKKLSGKHVSHPTTLKREIDAVSEVLSGPFWNMNYGKNLVHEKLEEEFAAYVGTRHAVAVNTGGMAIQMALRAFGVKPGDEVLHQVDTCVANAFAVLAAGGTPLFVDINKENFMMSQSSAVTALSPRSKVIMPVHIWGNPEDMTWVMEVARQNHLYILEDACLALGAEWEGKRVGSIGDAGVFSFGCLKPIQAGEGGIIVTNNEALARELRTIRNWGDMTGEYGVRDQTTLSWNGRVSEIVAAVGLEQLRGYPNYFEKHQELVAKFIDHVRNIDGLEIAVAPTMRLKPAFSQVVVKLHNHKLRISKTELMNRLQQCGIGCWHANFEPMNKLTFFRDGSWREWVLRGDLNRVERNYSKPFTNAEDVYQNLGLGFARESFLSADRVKWLIKQLDRALLQ